MSVELSAQIQAIVNDLKTDIATNVDGQMATVTIKEKDDAFTRTLKHTDESLTAETVELVNTARTNFVTATAQVLREITPDLLAKNPDVKNVTTGKIKMNKSEALTVNVEREHTYPAIEGKDGKPGREAVTKFGILTADYTFQGARSGIGQLSKLRAALNEEVKLALKK